MPEQPFKQRSYLLRLWPVQIDGRPVWHANLLHIPNGEALGFAGLPQLFAYLERMCEEHRLDVPPTGLSDGDAENKPGSEGSTLEE
ncbi:MAG: hypothetical protein ACOYYS_25890 [Chloroflexota bacterium]